MPATKNNPRYFSSVTLSERERHFLELLAAHVGPLTEWQLSQFRCFRRELMSLTDFVSTPKADAPAACGCESIDAATCVISTAVDNDCPANSSDASFPSGLDSVSVSDDANL